MKKIFTIILLLFSFFLHAQNYPFPQHVTLTSGTIKPNNYSQNGLDKQVRNYYDKWKNRHLKTGCAANTYYIWYNDLGYEGNNICVSEGQGYGMVIQALMAGYDANAKVQFDGLYQWYKNYPSSINNKLMSWRQKNPNCSDNGFDSATDGDMDIAYSLLLADKQWGSGGTINYLQEAINIINAIKQSEVYATSWSTQLGDWSHNDGFYKDGTRPSDFMFDHFRSYQDATGDANWNDVLEECYDLISLIQTNYSSATGLIPDFIQDVDGTPAPAIPNYLESDFDDDYYYNSCRVPWHLATDYLLSGDTRAKMACDKINSWIKSKYNNNVNNIRSGWHLNGNNLPGNNYQDLSFIAPFAVSATVDASNQTWLNDLWSNMKGVKLNRDGYYGNTIKMLSMLIISGNYWAPQDVMKLAQEGGASEKNELKIFPNPASLSCMIQFTQTQSSNTLIRVWNSVGQIVLSEEKYFEAGKSQFTMDVASLPKGIYFISVTSDMGEMNGTIIIQ